MSAHAIKKDRRKWHLLDSSKSERLRSTNAKERKLALGAYELQEQLARNVTTSSLPFAAAGNLIGTRQHMNQTESEIDQEN
jgi:hypothetical protein